tara:strand:- start:228 stop:485 length:258 start_codon:yes stop_codon:yes gene_type:complete
MNNLNIANIGQTIRAYDFASTKEEFIQGRVIAKGMVVHPRTGQNVFEGFTIEIQAEGNGDDRVGDTGYVPFTNTRDWEGRIELVA